MMTVELNYHKMYIDVPDLVYATTASSCADVKVYFGPNEREIKVYDENNASMVYIAFMKTLEDLPYITLKPGDRALIPTGLKLDIPIGYSVRIHPRSGLSLKYGLSLVNCEGIIDADYVEQVYIPIVNHSRKDVVIKHGERIAQLELVKDQSVKFVISEKNELKQKTNRSGGFGSTGV